MTHIETPDDFTKIKSDRWEDIYKLKKSLKQAGLYSVRQMVDFLNYDHLDPSEKVKRLRKIEDEILRLQHQIEDLEQEIHELESEADDLKESTTMDSAIYLKDESQIKGLISNKVSILEKTLKQHGIAFDRELFLKEGIEDVIENPMLFTE